MELTINSKFTHSLDFFNQFKVGFLILDINSSKVLWVNTYIADLLGYSFTEFLNLSITDIVADAGNLHGSLDSEYIFLKKDRTLLYVQVSIGDIPVEDSVYHYLLVQEISQDKIKELNQSEQLFRAIFDNAAIGITLANTDGKALVSNKALINMFGYSMEELRQMTFSEYTYQDDIQPNINLLKELKEGKRESFQMEKRYIRKDGQVFWAQLTVSRILGSLNNLKIIAMVEDISKRKEMEDALSFSENTYRTVFETTGTATIILEDDMKISLVNSKFAEIVGSSKGEIEGLKYWQDFCLEEFRPITEKYHSMRRIDPDSVPSSYECQILNRNQEVRNILLTVSIIPGTRKSVVSCMDITEVKEGEKILKRYQLLSKHARDIILFINNEGEIIEANDTALKAYGYSRKDLLSMKVHQLLPPGIEPLLPERINRYSFRTKLFESVHINKDGNTFPVEMSVQGTWIGTQYIYLLVVRDITERKRTDDQLRQLATHDYLTKIANRYLLEQTLQRIIEEAKTGTKSALLLIDLDNFKLINDSHGHSIGDKVLVSIVNIIRSNIRKDDFLARLGGDEFAIVLNAISQEDAFRVANKIRDAIDKSGLCLYEYKTCFNLTISVGVSMVDGTMTASKLLSRADIALYKAKETGRNKVMFFDLDDMTEDNIADVNTVINEIKEAIRENKLFLMFQPIFNLTNTSIIHYEALVRMRGTNGIVNPGMFIPIAEKFGLMPEIDKWVVKKSVSYLKNNPDLKLFVNISGISLINQELLREIEDSIKQSGIDPRNLGFEITETAAVKDFEQTEKWIKSLQAMGCKFALDDFGMGFASFSYLRNLPVDYIKIDGSYVKNIDKDETQRALVNAINTVAQALGKMTIAEFVEDAKVLEVLCKLGVNFGQGYYLGRPSTYPDGFNMSSEK